MSAVIFPRVKLRLSLAHAVIYIIAISHLASGFNVDVNSKVIHGGPRSSCDADCMFGFSVAQHREKGTPW